ncbi:MAG TPA: BRCT domain-containing protein, partial [Candidatus Eisenbacteria bacterium]
EGIKGIGPEVASSVHRFFSNPRNRKVLERLKDLGIRPVVEKQARGPQPLKGEVVVFSGGLDHLTRPEAQRKAETAGAQTAAGISQRVTLVVAGPGAGSKLEDAERLGIKVIDGAAFLKRIGER